MNQRRTVLLLCRTSRREATNVSAHVGALATCSRHDVRAFDPVARPDACRMLDLDEFDAVIVHYTIIVIDDRYLPPVLSDKIARFSGLKLQFVQDEYRWIDAITTRIRELGIDFIFTCVPPAEMPKIYGERVPDAQTVATLPAYVPQDLVARQTPPLHARHLDVGYRGRSVPYWLGRLGHEKAAIGREFLTHVAPYGLRCDISVDEDERIYGQAWYRFLESCRATLGTESGASIADYDGAVENAVKTYLVRHPHASFDELERVLARP